jgi:hypothetical protein
MGPHPEAQMHVDALKAADHNGYQQIIRPSRGMKAGLKILCSSHRLGWRREMEPC